MNEKNSAFEKNDKPYRDDIIFYNLMMFFFMAILLFVILYTPNKSSFMMFILTAAVIFNMIVSYTLGMQKGIITSIVLTFIYGTCIIYEAMVARTITEIDFAHAGWLFLFPSGGLLSGKLSGIISCYFAEVKSKKSLEQFVTIDAATQFYNQNGFFKKLDEEFGRAARYKTRFSILLVKIANFNELRSIYGEINSVTILQTIADIISKQVRNSDIKSLIDTNLLGILLTETDEAGAKVVIEKLHLSLDRITININNTRKIVRITPNIGIATIKEGDEDVLQIYDRAKTEILYDKG